MPSYSDDVGDTITLTDEIKDLDAFIRDTITVSDAKTSEIGNNVSDTISINETFLSSLSLGNVYLEDVIYITDNIQSEWTHIGSFSEDSQTDLTWTEI